MARIGLHGMSATQRGTSHVAHDEGRPAPGTDTLRRHAARHSRELARFARAGYAAKGIVYIVIGVLAVLAATGHGGGATDTRGALRVLSDHAAGHWLLLLIGVGLLGYALWAVIAAALDAEDRGAEPKGVALRVGLAVRGLAYGALGLEALRLFTGNPTRSDGNGAQHWSARLMTHGWGHWVVTLAGVGVIGYACYQVWVGARKDLQKKLRLPPAEAEVGGWAVRLARFGLIARAVVFAVIGWLLVRAGMTRDAAQAGGIDESLSTLARASYGPVLLGVVATGLVAYGVWQLANARYREIRVT